VSRNYFDVLGVSLPFGRTFTPNEDRIGAPAHVAVISHALWRRLSGGNPSIIGETLRLNSGAYTVIGVAPRGFGGPTLGVATDVWVPTALQPEVDPSSAELRRARGHSGEFDLRRSRGLSMIGRLAAGGSIANTLSAAQVIARRLESMYPDTNRGRGFTIAPLGEGRGLRMTTRPVLQQLGAAVALLLLIACVNVASLLLARGASRGKEVAVRIAVGASPGRLVRQWLAECVLLSLVGSLGALLIACGARRCSTRS
jgi:putative ABC transport system permease protein